MKKTAVATVTLFSTPTAAQHNKAAAVSLRETIQSSDKEKSIRAKFLALVLSKSFKKVQ